MIRVTRRAFLFCAAGIPLSLVLIIIDERLWPMGLVYLALMIALAGLDLLRCLPAGGLVVEATPPDCLYIGHGDSLRVAVRPPARGAPSWVALALEVGALLDPPTIQEAPLTPGQVTDFTVPLWARRRGTVRVERLWLRWWGPMGLVSRQLEQRIDLSVPVLPNIRAVRGVAIRFWSRDPLFGIKPDRQQGDGSVFESLRDYVPGLDYRSIDWKHSARHGALVCKEFRAERNHQIILAFDTGHLMSEPLDGIPKLDHAINAGLLFAQVSLRAGDRVGMFAFDSRVRMMASPTGGARHMIWLQRMAAELEYSGEETNFTLGLTELLTRLNRRSLVIVQSEFVDTVTAELMVENLTRLASRHLVIFVTLRDPGLYANLDASPGNVGDVARSVIADMFIRERQVVLERLRRLGIHCLHVTRDQLDTSLINRYLDIKKKELI